MANPSIPNLNQARRYIRRIKSELGPASPRYRAFLNTLRDYGSPSSSTTPRELIERIREILSGHESLLNTLKNYLPEGYEDGEEDIGPPRRLGRYAPNVILSWIEHENEVNLEEISEEVHIQCTKCKFCDGDRNAYAIRTNEPILLCELKGCNSEYHLHCLPKGLTGERSGETDIVVDGSHEHIVYIDKDPTGDGSIGGIDEGIPPGEIYCKECVSDGSSTVLQQYFTRCEEIRSHYSCSRDYVLALLERHMLDNPSGNIVDSEGLDVLPEDEHEEVHLKAPPRSELWYIEEMNKMARTNPFEKDGGTRTLVPERRAGEDKDSWSVADFMIGKPVRLYCNLDNEYHNGRIIDWRTSSVYPDSKMQKPCKHKDKSVHLTELDFYGSGPVSSCEFLVRFPANEGRRKKEIKEWIILEEHSLAVGITLVRGQYDTKSSSVDKWRPAMALARSALELVAVREFLQEGKEGQLFGQKIYEEAESGVSAANDLFALTSFFGGKDHDVLNLRNEVKGLITWELLEKYHINEELEGKHESKDEATSPDGNADDGEDEDNKAPAPKKPRRLSIPIPHKMGLALTEYKEQYHAYEDYKILSQVHSGAAVPDEKEVEIEGAADALQADDAGNKIESALAEQNKDELISSERKADLATSRDSPAIDAPKKEPDQKSFPEPLTVDNDMMEVDIDVSAAAVSDGSEKKEPNQESEVADQSGVSQPSDDPAKESEVEPRETDNSMDTPEQAEEKCADVNVTPERLVNKPTQYIMDIDIEEEYDEGIYADYDVVEVPDDGDSSSCEDDTSVGSDVDSVDSVPTYGRKGSKGSQTVRPSRSRRTDTSDVVEKGQTVIGGRRMSVDVVRTGHRGRPRHVNVSPETKNAPYQEESRKRPPPQPRAEPEPKKPAPKPVSRPKPAPRHQSVDEPSSDEDGMAVPAAGNLPKGITQRPSGKWVSQQ